LSRITIQEVAVTQGPVKGKNKPWFAAEVTYTTDRGENKTKKVMSFSNPEVFAIVSKVTHPTSFEATNDGAPYYNWTKLEPLAEESQQTAPGVKPVTSGRVTGSTYETAEERKIKQLYIIRQSSISNAIEYWSKIKSINNPDYDYTVEEILATAQEFVDFVYGTSESLLEEAPGVE